MFSVILITHDRPTELARAIRSALAAGCSVDEVLVVDDLGRPATRSVVDACDDPRVRYLPREGAPGPAASRNLGIRRAAGRYLVFLDDDDEFDRDHLDVLAEDLRALDYPRFVITNWTWRRWQAGAPAPGYVEYPMCIPDAHATEILVQNFVAINALAIDSAFASAFRFDERLASHEDWDWILSVVRAQPAERIELFGPIVNSSGEAARQRNFAARADWGRQFQEIYARWPLSESERTLGLEERRQQFLAKFGAAPEGRTQ